MPKPLGSSLENHSKDRLRSSRRISRFSKSWKLWEGWVGAVAIAELISLSIVLVAIAVIQILGAGSTVAVLHIVGLLQGIVLGLAQWLILHRYVKHIGPWVVVTAIAAMVAWMIGLRISTLMVFFATLNTSLTAAMQEPTLLKGIFLLGAWVGGVLGFAQWLVLKTHIRQAVLWIAANALAWALGLVVAFSLVGRIALHPFTLKAILAGTATGLVMGAIVGVITGTALIWLLKPRLLQQD